MKYKAILTGDVVGSTNNLAHRALLMETIKTVCTKFSEYGLSYDIYRGDSFQIALDQPEHAAKVGLLIRCALKSATPKGCRRMWDARISIGIGTVEYYGEKVSTSDGEAFRLSGHGLDEIKKGRFSVSTRWPEFNDSIQVSTSFLDTLVTGWKLNQATMMLCYYQTSRTDRELASALGVTPQNMSKRLRCAQTENVNLYLKYFERRIKELSNR